MCLTSTESLSLVIDMNIAIDARLYGLKHAGIGRYTQNLIDQLADLDTHNHYTIISSDPDSLGRMPKKTTVVSTRVRHYSLAEQTQFLREINQIEADLFHFPHFNVPVFFRRPFIVTIHDVLWHEKIGLNATTLNPLVYYLKYLGYRLTIRNAAQRSLKIVTPTRYVAKKVSDIFSIPQSKIAVTYESAQDIYLQPVKANLSLIKKYHLKRPFIIYTGSLYPHKNVHILVDVVKELANIDLVIVGARNVFYDQFKAYVREKKAIDQVHMLGFVPDTELIQLYQRAIALVQPSKSEGFGLPGLEAMGTGLPVICTPHPVLEEIYEDVPEYVDTSSVSAIAHAIKTLSIDKKRASQKSIAGKKQAKKYSWKQMAQETLEIYQEFGSGADE